jgi:signal transduction histidine kinase
MEAVLRRNSIDPGEQTLLLLRWTLIIATSYLLLARPADNVPLQVVYLFLAGYLASNLAVAVLLRRAHSQQLIEMGLVVFDAIAVSVALLLTKHGSSDFFLLYFVVLFIATLSDRAEVVGATAILITILHLYTSAHFGGVPQLLSSGELIHVPFLLVVALFFGHLVGRASAAEREAREVRHRERTVTDFVAGVLHDLKNPVGVIQAIAEIMLERQPGPLNTEQAELVRRIHANARHIMKIALNLIEARQAEAGRLSLRRESASLEDLVREVLTVVRTASDLKGVTVEFEADPTVPNLPIDVSRMDRAVWNLLDNAIHSSPAGGEVLVSLTRDEREVVLSVTDDGKGIPSEDLPLLFERYRSRVGGQFTSSGLGLFVARTIVEAHGGTIEVDSVVGGGATFSLRLPIGAEGAHPPIELADRGRRSPRLYC